MKPTKKTAEIKALNAETNKFEPLPQRGKNGKTTTIFEAIENTRKTVETITAPFRQIVETAGKSAQIVPTLPAVLPAGLSEITKTVQRLTAEHETAKNNVFYQLAIDELEAKEKKIAELTQKINTARGWLTLEKPEAQTKPQTLEFTRTETEKIELVGKLSEWLRGDILELFGDSVSDSVKVEVQDTTKQITAIFAFHWLAKHEIICNEFAPVLCKHVYFKGEPMKQNSINVARSQIKKKHHSPEQCEIVAFLKKIFGI
jgi:hypothetical protein